MEYFGKCQTQPHSLVGKYKICTVCYNIVLSHNFIYIENMCQRCIIKKNKYIILDTLIKASKSPGIKYIFHKILFTYL